MGIDKISTGRLPATAPAGGVRPPTGHVVDAGPAGPEARVPEDMRAPLGGGQASALSAGAEGPLGMDAESSGGGASSVQGPNAAGILLSSGLPIGGRGLARLAGGPGKVLEGSALSALRVRVSVGERSTIIRPADIGLTRIAIGS